jgi:hypothetical protein
MIRTESVAEINLRFYTFHLRFLSVIKVTPRCGCRSLALAGVGRAVVSDAAVAAIFGECRALVSLNLSECDIGEGNGLRSCN